MNSFILNRLLGGRVGLCRNTPPDPLNNPPAPPAPAPRTGSKIICEFCKCQLTPNGDALIISDAAREYRGHSDKNADLVKQIAKLESEKAELERRIREMNPGPTATKGFVL